MLIRILAVLLIAITPLLATVTPAAACSCKYTTTEETIEIADGLFVGRAISSHESTAEVRASDPRRTMTHVFEVEAVIKGEFDRLTQVFAVYGTGSCGFPSFHSELVGVRTVPGGDGKPESNLCLLSDATELLEVAGDSTYPPIPVSLERERELMDEIEAQIQAERDRAATASESLDRSGDGTSI